MAHMHMADSLTEAFDWLEDNSTPGDVVSYNPDANSTLYMRHEYEEGDDMMLNVLLMDHGESVMEFQGWASEGRGLLTLLDAIR